VARVEAAVADADVDLSTVLGAHHELSRARVWRGTVLVDWEADQQAGGCLLRPALLTRLQMLGAVVRHARGRVTLRASGRVLAALSADHADLVQRLGGADRVEMRATLRFSAERYTGGEEVYVIVGAGRAQPRVLLKLSASVRPGSPRSSPAKT
jgi:hypothetical protein